MSGIQISGLLSNSSFDWKSIVDQLVQADSAPLTKLNNDKTANSDKVTALTTLSTSLQDLQDSVQAMRSNDIFSLRTVSAASSTTWKTTSATGTAVGDYAFNVTQLATKAKQTGAAGVAAPLNDSDDVSALTLATLHTATALTAGTFTINNARIDVATTDSLQDVFDAIHDATGDDITASYDSGTDKITLTSASHGEVLLGSVNDTSNFLSALKLANNGTDTTTSTGTLGRLKATATLASAGLATGVSGTGSFTINGTSIDYDADSDSLNTLISRINQSDAGVTASYDSTNDRLSLTNNSTGDSGMSVTDTSGLLDALGLTTTAGATFTHGKNALYTVNGGGTLTSASNTLSSGSHGITGLDVTVNTLGSQTLTVESDTTTMGNYIGDFISKFNAVQDFVTTNTKTEVSGTSVTTSVLSDNREVQSWARQLQSMVFDAVDGATGTVKRLNDLGIDFDSISGHLTIKNSDKLTNAVTTHPDDVKDFFFKGTTGMGSKLYSYITTLKSSDSEQQSRITAASTDIDKQITDLQARLDNEREQLTNSFIAMLDAQSQSQNQATYLTNAFFKNNSSN
ncbi:MAG TPA: flagellar filament capping protein FliD [Opitutaceae bacterium]|nr:flagellar filament capping protein FliD [Opitutaceae bacterium]